MAYANLIYGGQQFKMDPAHVEEFLVAVEGVFDGSHERVGNVPVKLLGGKTLTVLVSSAVPIAVEQSDGEAGSRGSRVTVLG